MGDRIAASLALAAAIVLLPAAAAAKTPVETHGALRVAGGHVVDAHGKPVVLRGMSLFWSQSRPQYYSEATLRWLRDDWRVDVVRAAISVDNDGYIRHPVRELQRARTVIDAALRLGLYVIVDWHAHDPRPAAAAAFFTEIARRYGDRPNLIYETWNEPLPAYGWAAVIKPYHQQVIGRIRRYDPDNLVIAGTRTWSQDVDEAARDPLQGANIAYTLHFYAGTHRQPLRDKASAAIAAGAALFVTEWGTGEADGNGTLDAAETQRWWDFLEARRIGYVNWSVSDKAETTAALRPGTGIRGWTAGQLTPSGTLVRDRLRAMAMPVVAVPNRKTYPAPRGERQ